MSCKHGCAPPLPGFVHKAHLAAQHLVECIVAREDDGLVGALHAAPAQAGQIGTNAHSAAAHQRDGEALTPGPGQSRKCKCNELKHARTKVPSTVPMGNVHSLTGSVEARCVHSCLLETEQETRRTQSLRLADQYAPRPYQLARMSSITCKQAHAAPAEQCANCCTAAQVLHAQAVLCANDVLHHPAPLALGRGQQLCLDALAHVSIVLLTEVHVGQALAGVIISHPRQLQLVTNLQQQSTSSTP